MNNIIKIIIISFFLITLNNLFSSELTTEWSLISKNKNLSQYVHTLSFSDIYFIDENVGYGCTLDGKIFETQTRGQDWVEIYSNPQLSFKSIRFNEYMHGMVVGENTVMNSLFNGIAAFSGDAGNSWDIVDLPTPTTALTTISFMPNNYFYLMNNRGTLFGLNLMYYNLDGSFVFDKTFKFGDGSFEPKSISFCQNYYIIVGNNSGNGKHYYYISNKYGTKWDSVEILKQNESYKNEIKDVFCTSNNISYILTKDPNQVIKTDNKGLNYTYSMIENKNELNSIVFADSLLGIIAGNDGSVFKTTDAGNVWSKINITYKNNFKNVCYRNGVFFLSADSLFLVSRDYGDTWHDPTKPENNPYFSQLYKDTLKAVYFLSDNRGFFVGNEKKLVFRTDDGCNTFDTLCFQDSGFYSIKKFNCIDFNDNLNGIISSDVAYIMKTSDGGKTWATFYLNASEIESMNSMKYIEPYIYIGESSGRSERLYIPNVLSILGYGNFPKGRQVLSIDIYNDTAFIVGSDRTYCRYQNQSIAFPIALPNFNSDNVENFRCIKMLNDTGYVVSDYGIIYKTIDNGLSWNVHSSYDKPLYSLNWKNRNNMYIVGDGIILNSTDGGNSWYEQTIKNDNITDYKLRSVFVTDSFVYACGVNNVILKGKILNKTSIGDDAQTFKLYPNPVMEYLTLDEFDINSKVKIIDNSGKVYLELIPKNNQIDVRKLPIGSYILNIENNNKTQSIKFIKK